MALCAVAAGVFTFWYVDRGSSPVVPARTAHPSNQLDLLVLGDWGYGKRSSALRPTADRAAHYSASYDIAFDAAILAGDNFYGDLSGGVLDGRWKREFEEPLARVFQMPFYAALGNHDYRSNNLAAEFEYARQNPNGHWKLPSKWYAVDLPTKNPVATVLVLDSNIGRLTPDEQRTQLAWLESQLAAATSSVWRIVVAHHPLFSNGNNPEDKYLIGNWGRLFKEHRVDFYICGHDHSLQHLEVAGWPTSFLVSAGGGAKLQPIRSASYGPFSRSVHGFLHLRLGPDEALGTFVSVDGAVVHQFARSRSGTVRVLLSTGRDKPQPKKEGPEEEQ